MSSEVITAGGAADTIICNSIRFLSERGGLPHSCRRFPRFSGAGAGEASH